MLLTIFLLALTILQSNNQTHLIRRDVLNCKKKDQTIVLQDLIWNPQKLISIVLGRLRSFYFCVNSDTTFNNVTYKWPTTYVTSYASSDIPCLSTNREIVKRLCKEDNINGASFEKIENCLTSPSSNYTEKLNDLLNSNISITDIVSKLITVTENAESFKPIDLFLVSSIIDKFVYESTNLSSITTVISNVINTRTEISEESQRNYNATDQILYSFDLILEREGKPYEDLEIKESNLFVKIFTGLHGFIFKDNNEIIEIEEDMDFMSFAKIPQLSAAIYIPNVKARATVSLFLKDTLFNENKRRNIANNFGVILSDNIEQIYLIFKPADGLGTYRHSCGFWNYGFAKRGNWKLESRPKYLGVLQICEYSHVTHFGLLVIDEDFIEDSDILSVISSIEIGLSLFGILGIFLTGAVFKTWRENIGNKILIHYGIVSLVQIVLLYVSEKVLGAESWICILTGVLLHYTVLSQFCWMLVIGLLQYKRYIQVFVGNSRWVLIKACFVSYGIPAFPVMILFGFFSDTYVDGRVGLCYPTGNGLIYGVLLPIGIIVTVNILIFSRIIFELFCKPKINSSVEDEVLILRLRLVLLMFFMLGITWVFGFAAQIFESDFLIYLFLITSSIQGFMIFVFFIVFNKNARKMYVYLWNKYSCR
ncbi:PREDICTED: G-protein coupled receptor 126-like [Nicrophorus vespilloides]|uniref:G-protein coupled receptor 126-like n=1 Tax=Nicrophorus vespilloides TaxID=110193 RepID=A0ABM1MCK5_NICVS|nr:PREDICTED: G-protein coupled receptor 126-like [Nicrophorus vespilloides]